MLLLITKYNLSPKWAQFLTLLMFYFILIKLHYLETNHILECTSGIRQEDLNWLAEAHDKVVSSTNNDRRQSLDAYARYVADPNSLIIKFLRTISEHEDFYDGRTNEGKTMIALIDYVYQAIQNKELLKNTTIELNQKIQELNETKNKLIESQDLIQQLQQQEEKADSISNGSTVDIERDLEAPAVAIPERNGNQNWFAKVKSGCECTRTCLDNVKSIVIIFGIVMFCVSVGGNIYQLSECA